MIEKVKGKAERRLESLSKDLLAALGTLLVLIFVGLCWIYGRIDRSSAITDNHNLFTG